MSTPVSVPEWTMKAKDTTGTDGNLLAGCHIIKNSAGTAYQFTEPNINNVLASSPGTTLPTAGFTFTPDFNYNGLTGVQITMNTPVATGTNWGGQWSCQGSPAPAPAPGTKPPPPTGPQSGDFTAQAGT